MKIKLLLQEPQRQHILQRRQRLQQVHPSRRHHHHGNSWHCDGEGDGCLECTPVGRRGGFIAAGFVAAGLAAVRITNIRLLIDSMHGSVRTWDFIAWRVRRSISHCSRLRVHDGQCYQLRNRSIASRANSMQGRRKPLTYTVRYGVMFF